jgi:hypothetical protein
MNLIQPQKIPFLKETKECSLSDLQIQGIATNDKGCSFIH